MQITSFRTHSHHLLVGIKYEWIFKDELDLDKTEYILGRGKSVSKDI